MATLIKKAETKAQNTRKFEIGSRCVGQKIEWAVSYHDGRSYETVRYSGEIIRINPKTVTVKDDSGNIWRVDYNEIR
jgi:hypothetical protein